MSLDDIVRGPICSAVTWKDATIILVGTHSNMVCIHESGRWNRQRTSGDGPILINEITTTVIEDTMYVLGGYVLDQNSTLVHSLDLNTWEWTKLTPGGSRFILDSSRKCTSWAYKGDVYLLGVVVEWPESLELFCYNISANYWERITPEGDIPTPRALCSSLFQDDTVFLFGGNSLPEWLCLNDLYMLDLPTMKWKLIHGPSETLTIPSARYGHTLTPISKSTAALCGRDISACATKDCWLLDLDKAKQGKDAVSIWKRIKLHKLDWRVHHQAVLEPVSRRLWLVGEVTSGTILEKLSLNIVPLQILAKECAAKHMKADDPRLGAERFPNKLKKEIEAYMCE